MSILDYFTHPTNPPRPSQVQALLWLEKQTAKYLILEAPVGAGKSAIGVTFAQFLNGARSSSSASFILTPQRLLQKQYEDSFAYTSPPILATLYGKNNYQCASRNTTCDIGSIMKPKCKSCPYETAKSIAKSRPHTILNYKLALLLMGFTTVFKEPRKLLIFDECHNMEQELTEFDAVMISKKRCEKYKFPYREFDNVNQAFTWLKDVYVESVDDKIEELHEHYDHLLNDNSRLTNEEIKILKELSSLVEHSSTIGALISDVQPKNVDSQLVMIKDPTFFKFKRLSASRSFKTVFEPMAERFLFMSSTILDRDQFCKDLGIEPDETAFLSLDSEFPTENRPVYYMPVMKMNTGWKDDENEENRNKMIETIETIVTTYHSTESGIIHTANFAIASWLTKQLEHKIPHDIYHHNPESGDDRGRIIAAFQQAKKPGILISPSITEGLDLVEDLSRFAIIAKVGFPYLGDAWIKRKMELSQKWYMRQTLISIIQGCGRIVRDKDDHGTVYILDSSFGYLKNQSISMIPKWWLSAFHHVK